MVATVQKWGNSQAIRLPKIILDELSLTESDTVELIVKEDSLMIKKSNRHRRARKSLKDRFKDYNGNYTCTEYDWGSPVGKEIW